MSKHIRTRTKSAEVAQGYPGFAYHNATTEDLTQRLDRFKLRRVAPPSPQFPWGQWVVIHYTSAVIPVAKINKRPRTWLGRLWVSWNR